jgi:hypothetical protein
MGKMSRIMKISKWAVALTVIMVAVPEVLAAATYTSSSWFGSVKVEVIPPPAQPIPPKAYKPYQHFDQPIPMSYIRVNETAVMQGSERPEGYGADFWIRDPSGMDYFLYVYSYPNLKVQDWGMRESGGIRAHSIGMGLPEMRPYETTARPMQAYIGYEVFSTAYRIMKDSLHLNYTMDQMMVMAFLGDGGLKGSALVWTDASTTIAVSTSGIYSWLGYGVKSAALDGTPVKVLDGKSVELPEGTAGSHTLTLTLKSWISFLPAKTVSFQITV